MANPPSERPLEPPQVPQPTAAWYQILTRYHWLVLVVCTLAWSFDCLNQQIFNLARTPAMADLIGVSPDHPSVSKYGGWATSALMIGWATGGLIFGVMSDRVGRAKTLVVMILAYSVFTGLCGLAQSPWQFIAACFITGLGVGGIFPIGCTLVAESLPDAARARALGMLQAFSAVGNIGAGFLWLGVLELRSRGAIQNDWRWLFGVGIAPALLSIFVMRRIREPDVWLRSAADAKAGRSKSGSLAELFGDPRWRRRAIVGMLLAASGVIGLWGIGNFSNDLTQSFIGKSFDDAQRTKGEAAADLNFVMAIISSPDAMRSAGDRLQPRDLLGATPSDNDVQALYEAAQLLGQSNKPISADAVLNALDQPDVIRKIQPLAQSRETRLRRAALFDKPSTAMDSAEVNEQIDRIRVRQEARRGSSRRWAAVTLIMFNFGGFFGMYSFSRLTQWLGRRPTFAIGFIMAGVTTALVFKFMSQPSDLFWMVPLMGVAQMSLFGGYAIYFPELFPTRLRSTGASFCYNVARYVSATGPIALAYLKNVVFAGTAQPLRNAGVAMCACFIVGLVALIFAPETKNQPLPE